MAANVEDALHEPKMLHARVAAIRSDRTFVRNHLVHVDADVLHSIRGGKNLRPNDTAEWLVPRERTAVVDVF